MRDNKQIGEKGDAPIFSLADIYCLERFTYDFLGDDGNIEGKINTILFGGNNQFPRPTTNARGNFHPTDVRFINFQVTLVEVINKSFEPVIDEDSHNTIAGDNTIDNTAGFDNLLGRLSFFWEELALMTQLVQQREECSAALGMRRGNDNTTNFINDFYTEVSSKPNNF